MDWEEECRIQEEAERKANVPYCISSKGNPLRKLVQPQESMFPHNMNVLRQDMRRREEPVTGRIYAGIMDNMRYGGSE